MSQRFTVKTDLDDPEQDPDDMDNEGRSVLQSQGKNSMISVDAVDYYKQYSDQNDMQSIENQIVAECYLSFT